VELVEDVLLGGVVVLVLDEVVLLDEELDEELDDGDGAVVVDDGEVDVVVEEVGGGLCQCPCVFVAVGRNRAVWALAMPAAIPMVGTVSAATTPRTRTRPREVGVLIGLGASRSPCGA
jgi:hypothetical protein